MMISAFSDNPSDLIIKLRLKILLKCIVYSLPKYQDCHELWCKKRRKRLKDQQARNVNLQTLINENRIDEAFQHINDLFMQLNEAFTIPDRAKAESVVQAILQACA